MRAAALRCIRDPVRLREAAPQDADTADETGSREKGSRGGRLAYLRKEVDGGKASDDISGPRSTTLESLAAAIALAARRTVPTTRTASNTALNMSPG
jgi:hypothetical protein